MGIDLKQSLDEGIPFIGYTMIIDLTLSEKNLLLKTLATAHMERQDNSDLEELIEKITDSLHEEGNYQILNEVFQEWNT